MCFKTSYSQQIEDIYFHLYTDSLKKSVHNYINIDAKLTTGRFLPLTAKEVSFYCNTGRWEGNDLIIDSFYKGDSVVIKAVLKQNISLSKMVTVYLKKNTSEPILKTEDEILQNKNRRNKNN